jgi:lysophospholipase L1-like esterase
MNRGLDGASSGELLERFSQMIGGLAPKLIFLNAGKNDYYYKINKEITEKNTRELVRRSLENKCKVVLTTSVPALTNELNENTKEHVEIDRRIAQEFLGNENFMFIDFYKFFSEDDLRRSYTLISEKGNENIGIIPGEVDPIHFNKYGNALVAKILLREVFGLDFDHEKFIKDLSDNTKKYPGTV